MTVEEVQVAAKAMAVEITNMVQAFESTTGCIVHSIPVRPASGGVEAMVEVKVQIP